MATVKELRKEAADLKIAGASKMSKDKLAAAIEAERQRIAEKVVKESIPEKTVAPEPSKEDGSLVKVVADSLALATASEVDENRAVLVMPEYLEFLINFWDSVNRVYSQKSISVPIFGSGITRIKEHKNISDEELLKIMLWTFRISEMRFKYPAKLSIIIHEDKIDSINLLDIKVVDNGL